MKFHLILIPLLLAGSVEPEMSRTSNSEVKQERPERSSDCQPTTILNGCLTNPNTQVQVDKNSNDNEYRATFYFQKSERELIIRNPICDVCRSLTRSADCDGEGNCSTSVKMYLRNSCAGLNRITSALSPANTDSEAATAPTTPTITSEITSFNINSDRFQETTPISSEKSQLSLTLGVDNSLTSEANKGPVVALGILLALSMVLLVAVTIGWVTTYLIMKRREVTKNSTCTRRCVFSPNHARMDNGTGATVNTEDNDEEERYFQNPTYGEGGPSTNTRTGTTTTGAGAMYAVVDQLSRRTRSTTGNPETSRQQDSNGQYATLTETRIAKGSTQSHMTSRENNGQSDYYEINKDFMDDSQQS